MLTMEFLLIHNMPHLETHLLQIINYTNIQFKLMYGRNALPKTIHRNFPLLFRKKLLILSSPSTKKY